MAHLTPWLRDKHQCPVYELYSIQDTYVKSSTQRFRIGVNYINILRAAFLHKSVFRSFSQFSTWLCKLLAKEIQAVSIISTFYEHLFCTKVFFEAFPNFLLGFVIFRHKNFGAKAALKMLAKLDIIINIINIL